MLIPKEPAKRGALTDEVKAYYFTQTNRTLTTRELRLMPFMLHCALNNGGIPSNKLNIEEVIMLEALDDAELLFYSRSANRIALTAKYFDIVCEILKHTYLSQAVQA